MGTRSPRPKTRRANKRPIVIAWDADVHAGSTLAPCPPEGVVLDDGGIYKPSAVQLWLWERRVAFWQEVEAHRRAVRGDLWACVNGDATEGDHHKTTQIISSHPEPQAYLCDRIYGVWRTLQPERTFIVRGTEAHVGPSGATEESFARSIRAEKNPDGERWSWWVLLLDPHGVRVDCRHHPGTSGRLPWTQPQAIQRLAFLIFSEHVRNNIPHPQLAVRSHLHVSGDSYDAYPTRAIVTPAWQLKTGHAHKVASESISSIGGVYATIYPNFDVPPEKRFTVQRRLELAAVPQPWRSA